MVIGDLLNPMASSAVVYSLCFFQLYARPRDDMGLPNLIDTQNL